MKISLYIIIILFTSCSTIYKAKNNVPKNISTEKKVATLSTLWSEIKYNFINIDRITFNIDSLYEETMQKILVSKNDLEYYKHLDYFVGQFKDGHTSILSHNYNYNAYFDDIPADIKEIDHKFYFTSIKANANIDTTLVGAEIIEIDGVSTKDYITKTYFPYITVSTENKLWT